MVASTDIKFYVHTNNNAPQLQNVYGSMINVLDACLVDGINIGPVSSLTASGTTVTALFSSAHNLTQYQVIKITGANQSEFNGEHRILTVPNAQTVIFELAATPSVSTAAGTIIASLPPLGWEKPFKSVNANGGGKAAYRSTNLLLPSRPFLRVVDELDPAYTATYAKYAKVGIVEDMADIDTMLGVQAPFDAASPDKNWIGTGSGTSAINGWAKWYYSASTHNYSYSSDNAVATSGNRQWILVGNKDYFYILPCSISSNNAALIYGFGAFVSSLNVDNSNNFLSATWVYQTAGAAYYRSQNTAASSNVPNIKAILQRGYNQNANYSSASTVSLGVMPNNAGTGFQNYIATPSAANTIPFAPVFLLESVIRGQLPNLFWLFQNLPYSNYSIFEKSNGLYVAVNIASLSSSQAGQVILKIGDL